MSGSSDGDATIISVSILVAKHSSQRPVASLGDPVATGYPLPGRAVEHVPVLRVFGSTASGHTCLVHLHGLLPYMYVPWPRRWSTASWDVIQSHLADFVKAVESHPSLGLSPPAIHACYLVKGTPIYGYHPTPRLFIKIYLYSPSAIPKLAAHLGGTAGVLGMRHPPYETHIPYALQCMADLGMSGMGDLRVLRCGVRQSDAVEDMELPPRATLLPPTVRRQGTTYLELDCNAWTDIAIPPTSHITQTALSDPSTLLINNLVDAWQAVAAYRRSVGDEVKTQRTSSPPRSGYLPVEGKVEEAFRDVLRDVLSRMDLPRKASSTSTQSTPPFPTAAAEGLPVPRGNSTLAELESVDWTALGPCAEGREPQGEEHCEESDESEEEIMSTLRLMQQVRDAPHDEVEEAGGSSEECDAIFPEYEDEDEEEGSGEECETGDIWEGTMQTDGAPGPPSPPLKHIKGRKRGAAVSSRRAKVARVLDLQPDHVSPSLSPRRPDDTRSHVSPSPESKREVTPQSEGKREEVTPQSEVLFTEPPGASAVVPVQLFPDRRESSADEETVPLSREVLSARQEVGMNPFALHRNSKAGSPPPVKPPPEDPSECQGEGSATETPTLFLPSEHPVLCPALPPPTVGELSLTAPPLDEPYNISVRQDVPKAARRHREHPTRGEVTFESTVPPPRADRLLSTLRDDEHKVLSLLTQVTAATGKTGRFARAEKTSRSHLPQLVVACLELLPDTHPQKLPDPQKDRILAAFVCFHKTDAMLDESDDRRIVVLLDTGSDKEHVGPVALDPQPDVVRVVHSEEALILVVLQILRTADPDIVTGWDIQRYSLGYLAARAGLCGLSVDHLLARVVSAPPAKSSLAHMTRNDTSDDETESNMHTRIIDIEGRVVINFWRFVRSEMKLSSYTLQSLVFSVLKHRFPEFPHHVQAAWYKTGTHRQTAVQHNLMRSVLLLRVCNKLDLLNRTAELAKLFGIQFKEVTSRGSQFRVESLLLRLVKPLNYIMISPSRREVEQQNHQEGVPMVMEPHSGYYRSPVIVLDFRSLYPSMIIAYNLCFSTCVGKVTRAPRSKLGAFAGYRNPGGYAAEDVTIAPNSAMFVKPHVRKGVLPRMLSEILDTRVAVQTALKLARRMEDPVQERILDSRQIGLKMIANVTYGYTAATFSGRMPCSDIADAIVMLARETLERTMRMIETDFPECTVIYGDTDSLFLCVPGGTVKGAFSIGQRVVDRVTALNPKPVKLKLEKVYQPCFMVTKKRYVGNAYESPTAPPFFDAKGIECVRRDQCRATQKIQEKALKILFQSGDMLKARDYVTRQLVKVLSGDINVADLIIRQEVKLGTYRAATLPPAPTVARKMMAADRMAEPLYNERVPYIVFNSAAPRLIDMVAHPWELLQEEVPRNSVNAIYYITKQILPPLDRLFMLAGADVKSWVKYLRPRRHDLRGSIVAAMGDMGDASSGMGEDDTQEIIRCTVKPKTLHSYHARTTCVVCDTPALEVVCQACTEQKSQALAHLHRKETAAAEVLEDLSRVCKGCIQGVQPPVEACCSLDCELPWQRQRASLLANEVKRSIALTCRMWSIPSW